MHLTHIVIDDFLKDPHPVRNAALGLQYPPRAESESYPGRNATRALAFPGLENMISEIVHEPLVPKIKGTSYGRPRLAMAGDVSSVDIHIDHCHWSALLYLSLDEHCQEGTHFYRHKPTGLEMAPAFPGQAQAAGYPNVEAAVQDILNDQKFDEDNWERRMMIPMRFNRIAIFRGYLWHDAGLSFGTEPDNARLILPFFFYNRDQI